MGSGHRLIPLHPDDLHVFWPIIAPFAAQMAGRFPDEWPVQEIARQAASKELLLWVIQTGTGEAIALVGTKVLLQASGRKVLEIALCAGAHHRKWTHLISDLEAHGRRFGCEEAVIRSRRGWLPTLTGWREERETVLRKDLKTDGKDAQGLDQADDRSNVGSRSLPPRQAFN